MPKRVLDGDAMWSSTKLSECAEWMVPEYSWLYPLADANGSFEITNLRVIWGKVAAIRPHLTVENLQEILRAFHEHGLLFTWEYEGKRYAHWTGSEKPGRLPQPARRTKRYGPLLAPPVPVDQLREYVVRHQDRRIATEEASLVLVLEGVGNGNGKESRASHAPHPAPSAPGVCVELLAFWNAECGPLPKVLELTEKRQEKIRARLRSDPNFAEKFKAAVLKAQRTPFLCGDGERGWRASFDWLIANGTNAIAVLEGRYDDTNSKGGSRAEQRDRENLRIAGFNN